MNAIIILHPYKYLGTWCFDDKNTGLFKEPFVGGADTLLDLVTDNSKRCSLMFSEKQFPESTYILTKVGPGVGDGTIYDFEGKINGVEVTHNLWLCPALFLYYPTAPNKMYFKVSYKKA